MMWIMQIVPNLDLVVASEAAAAAAAAADPVRTDFLPAVTGDA